VITTDATLVYHRLLLFNCAHLFPIEILSDFLYIASQTDPDTADRMQSSKGSQYIIRTYQVPVPIGDCSVHLLVDPKGRVEKAIAMDGGTNSGSGPSAYDRIAQALKEIKSKLGSAWDGRFDAWVVTHWDADHYEGMVEYLKKNGTTFWRNGQTKLYCGAEPGNTVKSKLVSPSKQKSECTALIELSCSQTLLSII
jgi:hypothetical protein